MKILLILFIVLKNFGFYLSLKKGFPKIVIFISGYILLIPSGFFLKRLHLGPKEALFTIVGIDLAFILLSVVFPFYQKMATYLPAFKKKGINPFELLLNFEISWKQFYIGLTIVQILLVIILLREIPPIRIAHPAFAPSRIN